MTTDFDSIRVDDEATHARLAEFLAAVAPPLVYRLELYRRPEPLFETFG